MKKEQQLLPYRLQFFAAEGPGGEKTEEATPKKIEDARKEGQVAKSQELSMAVSLLLLFLAIKIFIGYLGENLIAEFGYVYRKIPDLYEEILTLETAQRLITDTVLSMLKIMAPLLLVGFLGAFLINRAQISWQITMKPLMPKLSNISPLKGAKRIFSMHSLIELIKSILKIVFIIVIAYQMISKKTGLLYQLYDMDLLEAIIVIGNLILELGIKISIAMLVIGLADYLYQKLKFKKDNRMTKQEIKDEFKQSEGDPVVKQQIKSKMRQASQRRMMQSIPKADVVITNPTHFAVAIQYDQTTERAPVVVAKGADYMAAKIKEAAKEHQVELVENRALARMLYYNVELDEEIPAELYQAVAEVLAYVYRIKNQNMD